MSRNTKGFTLAEMLTSMLVMSIISLAVVSLTMSLTTAQEYSADFYRHVQIARNSLRRIERDINKSKLITAGNSNTLVYWLEDANENGDIELTELRLITTDLATGKVMLCRAEFPAFWPPLWKDQWDNAMTVPIATNLNSAVSWIKNAQWAKQVELATEVTSLDFSASPAIPTAELLQIELTVGEGPGAVQLRSTASMRSNKLSDLFMDLGLYYLAPPED
ncbi:MAG: prepilin-type N-terminal cleavage/methylation domain-containing protein [Phycisphaerae bacterium]|nr:prepilin-type N-terminal cleavage/methylation domain-containing protein [Phycisphaerae bacterium]